MLGCASQAERYQEAVVATDFDAAVSTCLRLEEPLAGDCLVRVYAVHGRLEVRDCERVEAELWHEECLFQYAERAAAAGQLEPAFAACAASRYGRECSFHLIREAARPTLTQSPAEAAPALAPYLALEPTPDAPRLFWRTWFRDRLLLDLPVDPSGCPDDACRGGAREAIYGTLHAVARTAGPGFCSVPVTDPKRWTAGPLTDQWVAEWQASECQKRRIEAGAPGSAPG